jgi:hypothetical protein
LGDTALPPFLELITAEVAQYFVGVCGKVDKIQWTSIGSVEIIVPVYDHYLPAAISVVSFDIIEFSAAMIVYAEEILAMQDHDGMIGPLYFWIIDIPVKIHVRPAQATGSIDHMPLIL